ncbi:hypothetical protein BGZ57DRAFT_382080 [Hyaloscypha finlandica]|nr:hypothetical protein BGZ57DRAFT_382080 [Hyaloscypha finlandica]
MTPTFGFSVGDFISVVALITKVSKALKSTGGAASEYQHVCFELEALKGILERLATLQPDASNINQVNHIRATALGCQLPLQLFLQKIQKFETSLGASPSSKSLSGAVRKGQWAVFMTEEISRLRSEICAKMTIIHLSLVIHCSESLSRIEALNQELRKDSGIRMPELEEGAQSSIGTKGTVFQLQSISDINQGPQELAKEPTVGYVELNKPFDPTPENARALFTAVGTNCSSIVCPKQVVDRILEVVTALSVELRGLLKRILNTNLQVYTFLQNLQPNIARSPLLQQSDSIQFEDVLGRTKHLPYQFFRYWPMLVTYLQMEFRDLPGERLVNEGQYYIMDARSNGRSITDTEWERYVFPGAHVMMSMIVTSFLRGKGMCSRPNCTKRTQLEDSPSSMFQCPDCGTRYFPYPYSSFGFFSDQGDGVRDFEEWENFVGWVALKRADQNPDKSGAAAARDVMEEIKAFRRLHTPVEDGDWQPTAYPAESEPPSK